MCGNRLTAVTISTRALEWDGDAAAVNEKMEETARQKMQGKRE